MSTIFCGTCDSTGRVAEQFPGLSHFEPTEREVICPEPGCKAGVLRVECDGGPYDGAPCDGVPIGKLGGHDLCRVCMRLAKRALDDGDPPDHRRDPAYGPSTRVA